jgi:hypothetical protein
VGVRHRLVSRHTCCMTELEHCEAEIREQEANRRAGHKDVPGLVRALIDWRADSLWRLVAEKGERSQGTIKVHIAKNKEKPPTVLAGGELCDE